MGIEVVWQDERGKEIERVGDPLNRLTLVVLAFPLDHCKCLCFLDPYGDTYFNRLQIPVFLKEIEEVELSITDTAIKNYYEERAILAKEAKWQEAAIAQIEASKAASQAESIKDHLRAIAGLAKRSINEVHTYLRCIGD